MYVRRSLPTVFACAVAVLAIAAPAFAEGKFESHMNGWLTGHETRDWTDRNEDDTSTSFGAKGCSYEAEHAVKNITMELNRNDTFTPDEHYGGKLVTCTPKSALHTVAWGDKGKGDFDAALRKVDGSKSPSWGRIDVEYVVVKY
jgi:hypothetical protein